MEDLAYDDGGAYEMPGGGRSHASPNYHMGFLKEGDLRGLTCHKACYHLLHERLGYVFHFEDVWPVLEASADAHNHTSEYLHYDYGGIKKYHDQVSRVYLGVVRLWCHQAPYSLVYPY